MQGASNARFFTTGQIGQLYIVSSQHARGRTLHIFVLPEGEAAIPNGPSNAPLNPNAVEVYGITSGQPGWTETYGWLYEGPWVEDFQQLVRERKRTASANERAKKEANVQVAAEKVQRELALLATYGKK